MSGLAADSVGFSLAQARRFGFRGVRCLRNGAKRFWLPSLPQLMNFSHFSGLVAILVASIKSLGTFLGHPLSQGVPLAENVFLFYFGFSKQTGVFFSRGCATGSFCCFLSASICFPCRFYRNRFHVLDIPCLIFFGAFWLAPRSSGPQSFSPARSRRRRQKTGPKKTGWDFGT